MTPEQWTVDGHHPLIVCLAAIWLIWKTHDAIADTRLLIRYLWRRRHKPVTPAEDDVTRITSSHWPPRGD